MASFQAGDWILLPATGIAVPSPVSRWQYWRHFRDLRLPVPYLDETLSFHCVSNGIEIRAAGVMRARWWDWTDDVTERFLANLPPRTGYVVEADRSWINEFARASRSRFAWVCRLTGYHREHEYHDFEQLVNYQDFGTSTVILPR